MSFGWPPTGKAVPPVMPNLFIVGNIPIRISAKSVPMEPTVSGAMLSGSDCVDTSLLTCA
ncbi:hypothetical protein D3C73_800340 [compost metagenome]